MYEIAIDSCKYFIARNPFPSTVLVEKMPSRSTLAEKTFSQRLIFWPIDNIQTVIQTGFKLNLAKGLTKQGSPGYISKAVEGNSETQTTKAAARANLSALNLDNYIV